MTDLDLAAGAAAAAEGESMGVEGLIPPLGLAGYLVIDTETSGLPNFALPAEHPDQPRLAELVMILCNDKFEEMSAERFLIKPDGWSMTPGATEVTGLTDEYLTEHGVPVIGVLERYVALIDQGFAIVAHNAQFDTKVMRGELRRTHMDDRFEQTRNVCTMRAMTDICQLMPKRNRPGYKWPTLAEAYQHISGRDLDGLSHSAENDARHCLRIAHYLWMQGKLPAPQVHYSKKRSAA